MVMVRRGVDLVDQETIANELGLIVPDKDKHLYKDARTGPKPKAGYGTQVLTKEFSDKYDINKFFKKYNIPLKFTHFYPSDKEDLTKQLLDLLSNDHDIAVSFSYGRLYGTDYLGGHLSLVDEFDDDTGTVTLVDPERNVPKFREVSIDDLFKAIKHHGKQNAAGFWIFNKY